MAPEASTDNAGPPPSLVEDTPFLLPSITTTTTSTPSPSSSIHSKSPSIRTEATVSRPSSYAPSFTASQPGDSHLDEPSTTFSRRSSVASSMTTYSDESSADPYVRRESATFVRTRDEATPPTTEPSRKESELPTSATDAQVSSPSAASVHQESSVLASQPDDPPAYELALVSAPATPESETSSLEPVSPGGISLSDPVDESFFYKSPARRPTSGPPTISVAPSKQPPTTYSGLGLRLPSSINPNIIPTPYPETQQAAALASPADPRTATTSVLAAPVLLRIPNPPALRIIPASPSPDTSPVTTQDNPSSPLPTSPLAATVEPEDAAELELADPVALKDDPTPAIEEPILIAPLDPPPSPPLGAPAADMLPLIDSTINNVGVAVAGLVVAGGIAVGFRAWSGLSAVASAGWNWRRAAEPTPVAPRPYELTTVLEEGPDLDVEALEHTGAPQCEAGDRGESDDDAPEAFKSPDSGIVSTEWGEVHFPVPEGVLKSARFERDHPADLLGLQDSSRTSKRPWRSSALKCQTRTLKPRRPKKKRRRRHTRTLCASTAKRSRLPRPRSRRSRRSTRTLPHPHHRRLPPFRRPSADFPQPPDSSLATTSSTFSPLSSRSAATT